MDKTEVKNMMLSNRVFMAAMNTRFGLLQTIQTLSQAAVRSPEPIKGALSAELGSIICLMQWMIMLYGNSNVSTTISTDALNKIGGFVRCDVSEIIEDLKTIYGEGVIVTAHTISTWADQTLNGELWERTSEAVRN